MAKGFNILKDRDMNALKKSTTTWSTLVLMAVVSPRSAWSGGEIGGPLVRVPDPLSGLNPVYPLAPSAVPQPACPFQDARFGTRLMRVTRQPGLRHRN